MTPTPITSEQLAPVATPNYPAPGVNKMPSDILGASLAAFGTKLQSLSDNLSKAPEQAAQPATPRTSVLDTILGDTNTLAGKSADTAAANEKYGLAAKTQHVTDLVNEYNGRGRYYDNLITARQKNLAGTFGGATQQDVDNLNRQKNAELADIAIQHSAATGDLATAQTLIKQTIADKYQPLQDEIDNLTKYYQLSANDMTESEKQQAQAAIADKAAQRDAGIARDQAAYENQLKLADPLHQAQVREANASAAKSEADTASTVAKTAAAGSAAPLALAKAQGDINAVSALASDKNLASAVGPNPLARTSFSNFFTGGKNNFVAGVEQLRGQLSLNSLINAKAQGATFGALSDAELKLLSDSGSKLTQWAVKNKDGQVVGYNANEKDFKAELDKINNYSKLDYLLKGGQPADVGVTVTPDGRYWTKNSDGSITELK